MKINSIAPYFGSKRAQAANIVRLVGDHQAWFEPMCGSLAVTLAKPKARMEVVNDIHGGLVNLARVVANDIMSPQLFDRLSRTSFCKALYQECSENSIPGTEPEDPTPNLDRAYNYFVSSWAGRNGLAGTRKEASTGFCVRYTSKGGDPAVRFRNAVESIPEWWERLRGVTILNQCGIELVRRAQDDPNTVVYLDPPYIAEGDEYLFGFTHEQHRALASAAARFTQTRVVISYYASPLLDSLYPPNKWLQMRVDADRFMGGGDRGKAPEVLIFNGPAQRFLTNEKVDS